MTEPAIVRVRSAGDVPGCVDALRAVFEASRYPTAWPKDPAAWITPPGQIRAWVAEHGGAIVGQVGVLDGTAGPGLAEATGIPADELALVTRLYVSPAARGLGVARRLVQVVTGFGVERGLRIGLDVMETALPAIALYESLGWELHGTGRAHWTTQTGEHPTIRYYLAPPSAG